jgi:hypothetical protein
MAARGAGAIPTRLSCKPSTSKRLHMVTTVSVSLGLSKSYCRCCAGPLASCHWTYFREALSAVAAFCPSYTPPHYNKLRTTLLQKEKASVQQNLKGFYDSLGDTGCAVTSVRPNSGTRRSYSYGILYDLSALVTSDGRSKTQRRCNNPTRKGCTQGCETLS